MKNIYLSNSELQNMSSNKSMSFGIIIVDSYKTFSKLSNI